VTFLQLPFAISAGAMIHTPIVLATMPAPLCRVIETLIMMSGVVIFALLAYASFCQRRPNIRPAGRRHFRPLWPWLGGERSALPIAP